MDLKWPVIGLQQMIFICLNNVKPFSSQFVYLYFCSFHRSIKKLKKALPLNSSKRAAVLSAYVDEKGSIKSPAVAKFRSSIEKEKVETSAIQSVKEILTSVKCKRNKDAIASLNLVTCAISGPTVTDKKGAVKSLANTLGVNQKTIQRGKKFRTKVLHS